MLKASGSFAGELRLIVAHPPLDHLLADHMARAVNEISTPENLQGLWTVMAAFVAKRQ